MPIMNNIKNSKGFVSLLLVFFLVALLTFAGVFYAVKRGLVNNIPGLNQISGQDQGKVQKVGFSYKVKSITDEGIILNGERGDFRLLNDSSVVSVYKGPTKDSPKIELSALKVGDNVNMEFIAGKSATLFVSTI